MQYYYSYIFTLLLFLTGFLANGQVGSKSVLAEGQWFKMGVINSGVYTLNYTDLKQMGINPDNIDPQKLAVYGNGGGMLPQENSNLRPVDLKEVTIMVTGQEDKKFDKTDKVIFYAESAHIWKYNFSQKQFDFITNIYSDTNFYFLRIDNVLPGKRISQKTDSVVGTILPGIWERYHHEFDKINYLRSGRNWYGEVFDTELVKNFSFSTKDILADSIEIEISMVGRATTGGSFSKVFVGGVQIDEIRYTNYGTIYYYPVCDLKTRKYKIPASLAQDTTLIITIEHNKNGDTHGLSGAMLDYIDVFFEKSLQMDHAQKSFTSKELLNSGVKTFQLPDSDDNLVVLEVTNPGNIYQHATFNHMWSQWFSVNGGEIKEFVLFKKDLLQKPVSIQRITNQNLRGFGKVPDLIIVAHPKFETSAQKLADFRRKHDGMDVLVATTNQIYNEFSSGRQDVVAIRDLAKYFYDLQTPQDSLKYLLLMGEASYDYKERIANNTNFVPVYESRQSFNVLRSFASDDFYGFMEDGEGFWDESSPGNTSMDIGVGRIPCRTVAEADAVVNKIINYSTLTDSGNWSDRITFIADDNDKNLHIAVSEKYIKEIEKKHPYLQNKKLYLDYFEQTQVNLPGGERSKPFTDALKHSIDAGTLLVNYVGHGGPPSLGNERIIDKPGVDSWNNTILPLFITATCEFAVIDQPAFFSSGKYLVLKETGGGIGIISGTRPAYASANDSFELDLIKHVFNPKLRLGDVMRMTKNMTMNDDVYNRHFSFMGDPSLRLNIPQHTTQITSITRDGKSIDTLSALSKIKIAGKVTEQSGEILSSFNGKAIIKIYDEEKQKSTRGMANAGEDPGPSYSFKSRDVQLASVTAPVVNGSFETELLLPLSFASTTISPSKFSIYAYSSDGSEQAAGANLSYTNGGIDPNAVPDDLPPVIQIYLNADTFKLGDTVSINPLLVANLFDESGINFSTKDSSHLLVSVLNSDSTLILSEFYKPSARGYKNGNVFFSFTKLPKGSYVLDFSASDTYHNRASAKIDFFVVDTVTSVTIPVAKPFNFSAYPNPFRDQIFLQSDNQSSAARGVEIYSISGIRVKRIEWEESVNSVVWDGTDEAGSKVEKGMYVCKIIDESGNKTKSILILMQ